MQTSPRAGGRENPRAAGSQALRSAARDPRIGFPGGLGAPGRGPRLAHALGATPRGDSGLLYWDALERLKRQGVRHIVVAFPQIMVDSVLNLVEVPNQIAKEIGWRSWARIDTLDHATWPETGHPFADYWGIWVETECPARSGSGREPCCFTMGGCEDGRPYPPPRRLCRRPRRPCLCTDSRSRSRSRRAEWQAPLSEARASARARCGRDSRRCRRSARARAAS